MRLVQKLLILLDFRFQHLVKISSFRFSKWFLCLRVRVRVGWG